MNQICFSTNFTLSNNNIIDFLFLFVNHLPSLAMGSVVRGIFRRPIQHLNEILCYDAVGLFTIRFRAQAMGQCICSKRRIPNANQEGCASRSKYSAGHGTPRRASGGRFVSTPRTQRKWGKTRARTKKVKPEHT